MVHQVLSSGVNVRGIMFLARIVLADQFFSLSLDTLRYVLTSLAVLFYLKFHTV